MIFESERRICDNRECGQRHWAQFLNVSYSLAWFFFFFEDDAKFGKKILERMGWRNGKGLGKREQGRNENLRLKANHSGKGSCCDASVSFRLMQI